MVISLVLGALSGGLAGLLVALLNRALPGAKRYGVLSFAVLLAVLLGVSNVLIAPGLRSAGAAGHAERMFDATPAFRLIGEDYPEFKASFVEFVRGLEREGVSRDEAFARGVQWGQQNSTNYFLKYTPHASDSAVLAFATAFTDVINSLRYGNPKACADWMFGAAPNSTPEVLRLGPQQERAIQDALYAVVSSAKQTPTPAVDSAAGNALLAELFDRMQRQYGPNALSDLATLADPATARRDPARSCQAAHTLYSSALRMPREKSGPLLRYLLSSSGT